MSRRPPSDAESRPAAATSVPSQPATSRGQRTRARIVAAAKGVFEEEGFLGARIADIARRAGVAQGTFYIYFDSKLAVFRDVVADTVADIYASSNEGGDSDEEPLARIERANHGYLVAYRRNAAMISIIEQVATSRRHDEFREIRRGIRGGFVDRAARGIARLQEHGLADDDIDPYEVADALGSMVDNYAYVHMALDDSLDIDAAVRLLSRLWARAIGLEDFRGGGGERSREARTATSADPA